MRVQEDLILAYENGWYRQRTFDRNTGRGRVHAEGPNVVSYVAKSPEVAQWLVAKAEDTIVIRGVEYSMQFKPWMTKTELEERRRLEDESKFWVMAIRVPLRVMFHVENMVETSMGRVIKSLQPEQDRTRPKLMNLKFELVREAEEKFEPELSMRLGREVFRIKFVCRHTPWCDKCKRWFHTSTEGCPREGATPGFPQPRYGVPMTTQDKYFRNQYGTGEGLDYRILRQEGTPGGGERAASSRGGSGGSRQLRRDSQQDVRRGPVGADRHSQRLSNGEEESEGSGGEEGSIPISPPPRGDGMEESPGRIPEGVRASSREDGIFEEAFFPPLVCTMQGSEVFVIGLRDRNDQLVLPAVGTNELPMPDMIQERVRYLFKDRFDFRIFPEFFMPRLRTEVDVGKAVRFSITFIYARMSVEHGRALTRLDWVRFH
ncbi:hypothetical protein CBR_g38538 [Chara braunii]|uniref:Uncharacterized protein n=1 Tax=Chara braunii TaxID=69332 RepID=A0A388JNZ4_CHABU|nr:hypothetical protein CBR_g38538 [Chara braunii]|eukprot:GBG59514.1 hypothetical protein CBR_g38538 [Chara braunii]